MKAVILAGGHGTRISEESESRPKPVVVIGGRPILWHIMTIYATPGITDLGCDTSEADSVRTAGVISMNADRHEVPEVHLVEPTCSSLGCFRGTSWGISRLNRQVCATVARPSPTKPRTGAQRITESEPMVSG
jgi:molybdopterin-guanine dinucleotide biosynthesis protein A